MLRTNTVLPICFAALVCTAALAVWQTTIRGADAAASVTAGLLFLASLLFARYMLRIPWASGATVYLLLLGLFHLGLVVPWALGVYDISRAPTFVPQGLSRSIALIDYALIAFDVGLILTISASKVQPNVLRQTTVDPDSHEVYIAGCLLLGVGITMFMVGLIGLDPLRYFRLTYSETFRLRAESDPRLFGSGITIAFIGLSIGAAGASRRHFRVVATVGALWLAGLVYWGFRGPALIAVIIVYIIARKKGVTNPRWAPLSAVVAVLLILPVLRTAREAPLNERFGQLSFRDFNLLDSPAEMGMSIRPLVETIDLVGPKNYRYGRTYWIGILGIVPNLALRWENSSTQREEDLPPNHWITAVVEPWTYKNYGGMGFSAIAEPYMNFGVGGVIVYFVVLSCFLVWLEQLSVRNSYALAAWALVLGPLLWTTRNDFSNFFRSAAWGLLTLVGVKTLSIAYGNLLGKAKTRAVSRVSGLERVTHV